jgi:hypothetical protein
VFLVVLIFVLQQASQLAITPLNEGMDFIGHLSYMSFISNRARPPSPTEPSMPTWVHVFESMPGPDFTDGTRYQNWASLPSEQRKEALTGLLQPQLSDPEFVGANYESQQPPLYYALMGGPYRLSSVLPLDVRAYALSLISVVLASTALVAVYATFRLYVAAPVAMLGTLAVAWFPNLLSFQGRITNDSLSWPLIAWAIYLMARIVRGDRRSGTVVFAGVLLGLSVLTKSYAITLIPLYLLVCALPPRAGGRPGIDGHGALAAVVTILVMIGPVLAVNYLVSGQLVLLGEVLSTGDVPLSQRLTSVVRLDWPWFLSGVIHGFWWSGYFSFVVRGFYYLPLLIPVVLVGLALRSPCGLWKTAGVTHVHILAIAFFVAGLAWHAGLTTLSAERAGEATHGGSEGWYLDVLVGSVFAVLIVGLAEYARGPLLARLLALGVLGLVLWNLLGRAILLLFWSGQVAPGAVVPAGLSGATTAALRGLPWAAGGTQVGLPGAIGPAWLTVLLPLTLALALSAYVLRQAVDTTD